MEAGAEALLNHRRRTVVTNHLTVATILNRKREVQVSLAGGVLKHSDQATTGEATREFLDKFRVGYGIFGIGGVTEDGDLMDFDFRDIGVSATAMKISRKRLVALDHSKRSEEHTSELQSLMRISYAVFCLKTKINTITTVDTQTNQSKTSKH